jgi:cytochrome P450
MRPQCGYGELLIVFAAVSYLIIKLLSTTVFLILMTGIVVAWILNYRKIYSVWSNQGVPGPKPVIAFGNMLQPTKKGFHVWDMENRKKYGKFWGTYVMQSPDMVVCDLDIIRNVFVKDFDVFTNHRTFRTKDTDRDENSRLLDKTLNILHDENWKRMRTFMTPAFSTGKIKLMMPLVEEAVTTLTNIVEEKFERKEKFDLKELFSGFTMDVISSVAFGTKIDSQRNPDLPIAKYARQLFTFKISDPKFVFMILFPVTGYLLSKLFGITLIFSEGEEYFKSILSRMLKERKTSPKYPPDFLQLMINASKEAESDGATQETSKDPLLDHEIMAQMFLFLIAGYETTATTFAFAAYNLTVHPETQTKCYEEVAAVMEKKGSLSYDDIQHGLPYLEAVVMETLRLYPPAVRTDRIASEPYTIGEFTVPKDAAVAIPIYVIHHSEEFYEDPENFNPDRFLPEERRSRDPLTYLPFGFGPRNCIAMRFAMIELKLCLAHLIWKFELVPCDKTEIPLEIDSVTILKPKKPIIVDMKAR